MKKIIDGKIYDTETATEVAFWDNGLNWSDFHCCEETLYITPNTKWFLYGEGHALTEWAEVIGKSKTRGEDIKLLTADEAREWLELHGKTSALEKHFEIAEG